MSIETIDEVRSSEKQRHGCVTAWLILMIVANALGALIYLFASDILIEANMGASPLLIGLLAIAALGNVFFAIMLMRWKKIGFYGFIATSILSLIINISIGIPVAQSVFGLVSIAILYGILQITQDNVSAWQNME